MFATILNTFQSFLSRLTEKFKKITRPATASLATDILSDLPRSKYDLIIENAILRQQLVVLNRTVKRPNLTNSDRFRLTFLARLTNFWPSALHIVQPETLLRWHRDLFRRYWKRKIEAKDAQTTYPSRDYRSDQTDGYRESALRCKDDMRRTSEVGH